MQRILKYYSPNNAFIADKIRFVPNFKQLSVGWSAFAPMSEGTERFVDEYLPIIRNNNPQVEFKLSRSLIDVDPFIVALYEYNRERAQRLCWKHPSQILAIVEQWSIGGDYRSGKKRKVATILPRGLQIWNTETKGHDIFTVYSKWKADPPDPDALTSMTHPHLCYRRGPMLRKRKKGGQ